MQRFFAPLTALAMTALFTLIAQAGNPDLWFKMIDVRRDSGGKITELVYKKNSVLAQNFSSSTVLDTYRDQLNAVSASASALPAEKDLAKAGWTAEEIKDFKNASKKVFDQKELLLITNNRGVNQILKFFENALNGIYSLHILAAPGNPGYFFERRLIDKAMNEALGMADGLVNEIPGLNIVKYLLDETLGMMAEKRSYGQYLVLYFLENYSPEELKLTAREAAYIKSSLYEGQIKWYDFKAMEKAKANWALYGVQSFENAKKDTAKRVKKYSGDFDVFGAQHSYAFASVEHKGQRYVMNLKDKKSKLQGELSTAYDFSSPTKILQFRQQMQLVQFATQLLPIPGFIKGQLSSLISSYFRRQKQTEGNLFAHFVSEGMATESRILLAQTNNPFLARDW